MSDDKLMEELRNNPQTQEHMRQNKMLMHLRSPCDPLFEANLRWSAADEIEDLRAKLEMAEAVICGDGALITGLKEDVAKLTEERDKWFRMHEEEQIDHDKSRGQLLIQRARIAELKEKLTECEKDRSAWQFTSESNFKHYQMTLEAITAAEARGKELESSLLESIEDVEVAEARIAELESALELIADQESWGTDGGWNSSSYPDEIAMDVLSRKSNLDVLEAYRDGVIEECAEICATQVECVCVNASDEYNDGRSQGANVCLGMIRALKKGTT